MKVKVKVNLSAKIQCLVGSHPVVMGSRYESCIPEMGVWILFTFQQKFCVNIKKHTEPLTLPKFLYNLIKVVALAGCFYLS